MAKASSQYHPFCAQMFEATLPLTVGTVFPNEYFMFTELAFGGCGGLCESDVSLGMAGILGTAIGFL